MGEKIRVLHIVHLMNRGGMESRIMDLYRCIDKKKYQFDFYIESGEHGAFEEEILKIGGRLYYPEMRGKHGIPNFKAFYYFLRRHPEYKIIYAYNQWAGMYLKEAKKCNVPNRIAYARTAIQTKSLKNTIKNVVKKNVNKYATHRFAVSKKAGIWLFGEKFIQSSAVKIWPNAINTEEYKFFENIRKEVRSELSLTNELAIIHVGNIRFEKNHEFLLDTFAAIRKEHNDAKLFLVGGGSSVKLEERIARLGIDNCVRFLGVRSDVPRLLQGGDIFIFPSLYEGFPGAVLEAEASGLWCLVSDAITDEVDLTSHIKRLPLSKGVGYWASTLEQYHTCDRENAWKEIRDAGYDINQLSKRTEAFFDNLIAEE